MSALVDALRSLTVRQIGVLVAVALGAVGVTYGVYAVSSGPDRSELEADQQQIAVRYGNLVNEVSISGSLIFPERDTLTFGIPGTVAELLVAEGQAVEAGQALARLDVETIAALERSVAQSQIDLRDAEDALAEAKDPHTVLGLAQAEQKVGEARLTLDSAQDALARLLEPPPLETAQAEAKVAEAKLELQDARAALDTILDPPPRGVAEAEAAVASANLTILELQDDLARAVAAPAG